MLLGELALHTMLLVEGRLIAGSGTCTGYTVETKTVCRDAGCQILIRWVNLSQQFCRKVEE